MCIRDRFEQNPGGAPANVLACAAKLGRKTAFIGKVGDDIQGRFLADTLNKTGIDTRALRIDGRYFTTLAFVELAENGERSFSFARKPGADTQLSSDELDRDLISHSDILHFGSLSLTDEPARSATTVSYTHLDVYKRQGPLCPVPGWSSSLCLERERP